MPKLMIVTRFFPPTNNGLADHSALLVKCLSKDFDSITVVCEKTEQPVKQSAPGCDRTEVDYCCFTNMRKFVSVVDKVIEETRPDVVIFQYVPHMWGRAGIAVLACTLPLRIRLKFAVPVSTYIHELYYDWSLSPKKLLLSVIHRMQLAIIGCGSSALIVTNEHRRRILARLWGAKVFRVPAGNVSARKPDNERSTVYPWPYITWYGTLSDGQQLETLVEAFCRVALRFVSIRLVLVGAFDVSSPTVQALRSMCASHGYESRLVTYGFAEDDKLSDILSGSILNLHANESGPSGRRGVIAAYLRSGRPFISVDGKETDPEFKQAENVLLVPGSDSNALAEAIEAVLTDESLRQRLEQGARELFKKDYSDEAIRSKLLKAVSSHFSVQDVPGLRI
ncbi:glycosyltransferase family 4 protein [Alicyclobacillus ferrooxydans]|uniref:Glycosyl transferase family 1 domain-containing protein n=1 Tax=Alicyclobacillus ferrooxydans TaxID=471514 RepID=A0A0P9C2V8_9BACL|nr:glycosyltransferase [Alicyclobacillus ferrooxydans]KPV39321.1 hypothetical protein AN477_22760 [Alicyclobacillus ferrooxydans]